MHLVPHGRQPLRLSQGRVAQLLLYVRPCHALGHASYVCIVGVDHVRNGLSCLLHQHSCQWWRVSCWQTSADAAAT